MTYNAIRPLQHYIAFWRDKNCIVMAADKQDARTKAAAILKTKSAWEIRVALICKNGKPVNRIVIN
jgi:hypothetical protein